MKIQERQGYCLFLTVLDAEYYHAKMSSAFYVQDINGLWQEVEMTSGYLHEYSIAEDRTVCFQNRSLDVILKTAMDDYEKKLQIKKEQRAKAEQLRLEQLKKMMEQEQRREQEAQRQQEEIEKENQRRREESEKRRLELEENRRIEVAQREAEQNRIKEEFERTLEERLNQQLEPIYDSDGIRWYKCKYCGKSAQEDEFSSYGGVQRNVGICRECSKHNANYKQIIQDTTPKERNKRTNLNVCPECGGTLREKVGRFGNFWGCSNYPACRFTRKK